MRSLKLLQSSIYAIIIVCTLSINTKAQLSGTYTIGSGSNYTTLTDAVNQLETVGISGSVIFNIKTGIYNEHIEIGIVNGVDSTNTITFQSESGNNTDVVVSYNASVDSDNYVIKFNGAEYITLQNLTLKAEGTNYNRIFVLDNDAHNINIVGNMLQDTLTTSGSDKLAEIYAVHTTFNNLNISNNNFSGGAYGIYATGDFANVSNGVLISRNTFSSVYKMTIRAEYILDLKIKSNALAGDPGYQFYLNKCDGSLEITKNKLTGGSSGIYLASSTGANSAGKHRGLIANNFINQTHGAGSGISLNNAKNLDIYYNSIYVTSTASSDACLGTYNGSSINIVNNIFVNGGGGYAINIGTVASTDTSNYNDLYTTGSVLAVWDGNRTDLSALQAASGKEANSISNDPNFFSNSDLHVNTTSLDGKATPLAEVSDDIDGDIRDAAAPDIGADEFTFLSNIPPSITSSPDTVAYVGSEYSYIVMANDPDGDNLTFKITSRPSWLTIDTVTGELKGTPRQSDLGINPVTLMVDDGKGGSDSQSFNINVDNATGISKTNSEVPNKFELCQNYPNPFNPSTIIEFDVPQQSHVTLRVYNILGEEVATLVNGVKQPGSYEVKFSAKGGSASGGDALNLSSGIYFYRLTAGQNILTKKMILLK